MTQVLAAFAGADDRFAADLATLLIDAAPYAELARGLREAIGTEAQCTPEYALDIGASHDKAPDLAFEGPDWALLVELKLYSDYHHGQLCDYLEGGAKLGKKEWALMSVKRAHGHSPEEPDGESNWIGAVRWGRIRDRLHSEIAPQDADLARLWRAFIKVEIENGDFGMTEFDPDLVPAFATWKKARKQLQNLLAEIVSPIEETLRRCLDDGRSFSIGGPWPTSEAVTIQIDIPKGSDRLHIDFYPRYDEVCFWISEIFAEVGSLPAESQDAYRQITARLRADHDFVQEGDWSCRVYEPDDWMRAGADATAARLIEIIEDDMPKLCESGVFYPRFDPSPQQSSSSSTTSELGA